MKASISRILVPESRALNHLEAMAVALKEAVDTLAQMLGASAAQARELHSQLEALDSHATATHMGLLTSLRSAFVTPLPRQDLYLLSHWLNRAIENTCTTGTVIRNTGHDRLPTHAMDALEILGQQAELTISAITQLRDLDTLETTWIHMERLAHRAEHVLVLWRLNDAPTLLSRAYSQQREVSVTLDKTFDSLRSLIVELGQVLVRES